MTDQTRELTAAEQSTLECALTALWAADDDLMCRLGHRTPGLDAEQARVDGLLDLLGAGRIVIVRDMAAELSAEWAAADAALDQAAAS